MPGTQRLGYVSENRSAILAAPMTLTSFKRKLELIFEVSFYIYLPIYIYIYIVDLWIITHLIDPLPLR